MADAQVTIWTQVGDQHDVEMPLDMKTEDFINELVAALNLPRTDGEGHLAEWQVANKNTGKILENNLTLEQNGVKDGHGLVLMRVVVAC